MIPVEMDLELKALLDKLSEEEEISLLREFLEARRVEGQVLQDTEEAWLEFAHLGLELYRTLPESRFSAGLVIGANRQGHRSGGDADAWDRRWWEWVITGFWLAFHYHETRSSSLLIRITCQLADIPVGITVGITRPEVAEILWLLRVMHPLSGLLAPNVSASIQRLHENDV